MPRQQYQGQPRTQGGPRKEAPSLNDPNLLKDDMDEEINDGPSNINEDPDLDSIKPAESARETRKNLIERFKNWIAPKVDNIDDDSDEE